MDFAVESAKVIGLLQLFLQKWQEFHESSCENGRTFVIININKRK